ncbi:MAG: CDP-alcohol phosphatidyltransferase family protein [Phocaeicola sp.]
MRYTFKYFKDNMPEWKRKKDPVLSQIFYRPVAFWVASVCANLGIMANTVSYFSAVLGILACALFCVNNVTVQIIAAILVNIWLILDCTDGNLARSYKRQLFGEFADGISSYLLVGLLCTALGFSTYLRGGLLVEKGCVWMILMGALASSSDSMMRLIYQKYRAVERELADAGLLEIEKDVQKDHSEVRNIKVRIRQELGIGGLLPLSILIATILGCQDIIVMYCFIYYGGSAFVVSVSHIRKAIKRARV